MNRYKTSVILLAATAFISTTETRTISACINEISTTDTTKESFIGFQLAIPPSARNHPLLINNKTDTSENILKVIYIPIIVFRSNLQPINFHEFHIKRELDLLCVWLFDFDRDKYMDMLATLKTQRVVGSVTKVVLVLEEKGGGTVDTISELFNGIWKILVKYQTVVLANDGNEYNIYSYFPFSSKITWRKISSCLADRKHSLFASVPTNFEGYPCTIGYSVRPPYILPPIEEQGIPGGNEIIIVRTIAESLNMSVIYKTVPDHEEPIQTIVNGKLNGLYRMAYYHEIDIIVADMHSRPMEYALSSVLYPCMIGDGGFCIPRQKKIDNWRSLYSAFTEEVWFLMLGTAIFLSIALYASSFYYNSEKLFLVYLSEVFYIHVEIGMSANIIESSSKFMVCLLLLYSIIETTLYKSSFTTLLTIPHRPQKIKTVEEAYASGLSFYVHPAVYTMFTQKDPFWNQAYKAGRVFLSLNFSYHAYMTAIERKGMFIASTDMVHYMLDSKYGDLGGAELIQMIQNMVDSDSYPAYFIMTPGHPLQPMFMKKEFRIIEAGLPQFWLKEILFKAKLKTKAINDGDVKAMSLIDLSILFYIYCIMFVLDIIVFVFERYYYKID